MSKWQLLAAALAVAAVHAHAQTAQPVESRLEARKVVRTAEGRESLTSAEAVKPGETLEYTATYRNTGKQPVRNLAATLPIPPNTELVPDSARPAAAMASLDGRTFAAVPLKRRVMKDGRAVEEEIPLREYRYLRWNAGELAGESSVVFLARVRVVDVSPAPPGTRGAQ